MSNDAFTGVDRFQKTINWSEPAGFRGEADGPLEKLNTEVPWEVFRTPLAKALKHADGVRGGRLPYDPVLVFNPGPAGARLSFRRPDEFRRSVPLTAKVAACKGKTGFRYRPPNVCCQPMLPLAIAVIEPGPCQRAWPHCHT